MEKFLIVFIIIIFISFWFNIILIIWIIVIFIINCIITCFFFFNIIIVFNLLNRSSFRIFFSFSFDIFIIALNKIQTDGNECFEFLNFYYNSSIYCQLEKSFTNLLEANSVRININFILISVIICYDYSFETDIMNKAYKTLLNIIKLNYKNF